jgi:hypothetical protein
MSAAELQLLAFLARDEHAVALDFVRPERIKAGAGPCGKARWRMNSSAEYAKAITWPTIGFMSGAVNSAELDSSCRSKYRVEVCGVIKAPSKRISGAGVPTKRQRSRHHRARFEYNFALEAAGASAAGAR